MMSVEPPTKITWPDPNSEDPVLRLHAAIFNGDCAKIKKIIKSGVSVEKAIGEGHTPLFCAAFHGQARVVKLLLKLEADPNRCCSVDKCTPMHAACWSGNKDLIKRMISAGGDLRFHDSKDRSPKDWASMQPDYEKRKSALDLLEFFHLKALNDVNDSHSEVSVSRGGSFGVAIRHLINPQLSKTSENRSTDCGKKFQGGIPLIDYVKFIDVDEDDDAFVSSYSTGAATEMVSRLWVRQRVTLRRIGMDETSSDLLLKEEQRNLRQLRLFHPGLLLLMGVTQRLDKIQLVYEPVQLGSLYHRLHVARQPLPDKIGVLIQVAEALDFLHSRNLLHCSVSSNSVHLISPHVAKLGCYETLTDINENHSDLFYRIYLKVPSTHWDFIMRWMSPEAARQEPLSIQADIYSFCCLMLETLREKVPWSRMNAEEIRAMWQSEDMHEFMLPVSSSAIPADLKDVLDIGLQPKRDDRQLELEYVLWKLRRAAAGPAAVLTKSRRSGRSEMSSRRLPVLEPQVSMDERPPPPSPPAAHLLLDSPVDHRNPTDDADLTPVQVEVKKAGSSSIVDRLPKPAVMDKNSKSPPPPAQHSMIQPSGPPKGCFQSLVHRVIARKKVRFDLPPTSQVDAHLSASEFDRARRVFEGDESVPAGSPKNVNFTRPPFRRQSSLLAIKPASHLTECPTVIIPDENSDDVPSQRSIPGGDDEEEVDEEDVETGGQPSSSPLLDGDVGEGQGGRTSIGTQCELEPSNLINFL